MGTISTTKNQILYNVAKTCIPGGTQLLSKRPEMFLPDGWINYYESAKGCEIVDIDGNKFIDMISMGIGTCILGYADEDVNKAVKDAIDKSNMTSLNCPEEVELAKLLIKIHPWAEMARFVRSGGEAMSVAVRIARAASKKDRVLFCGYHGWHDWYISANLSSNKTLDGHLLPGLEPNGIPRNLIETSIPFNFNNTEEFLALIRKYDGEVGVVVLESIRNDKPEKEFIDTIRNITRKKGIVFIVDEITAGFRLNVGGAHLLYNMEPDIAVFAKAISNGYPMGAVIGRKDIMQAAQKSFISSTYWTERIGSVAALATLKKLQVLDVPVHLVKVGKLIQKGWADEAKKHGLKIHISGIYPLSHFEFEVNNPLLYKTVFTKIMLEYGFLASTVFYSSYAHKENIVNLYIDAVDKTFERISKMTDSEMMKFVDGKVCHSGFKRLN
jgi:glutamate-1-semialdehyde aminotransferase